MTIFRELDHPRAQSGAFSDKLHSVPEVSLALTVGSTDWASDCDQANDPDTAAYRITELARHDESTVRAAVASNPSIPQSVLRQLATDIDYGVRWNVARNPRTHTYDVGMLAAETEPNATIRHEALVHPNLPPRIAQRIVSFGTFSEKLAIAGNPALSPTFLVILAVSDEPSIRAAVARNPGAPARAVAAATAA